MFFAFHDLATSMAIFFIGLGSQPPHSLPNGALNLLKSADEVYADVYTSPWRFDLLKKMEKIVGKPIKEARRSFLEDVDKVVEIGREKNIVILCMGDPFIATTHSVIRVKARQNGIKVKALYSSSFINALFGELGLHFYKLGFIGTVMDVPPSALTSIYLGVKGALEAGRHSILLLEFDYDKGFYLSPSIALSKMQEIESSLKGGTFEEDLALIVASRVGFEDQKFTVGFLKELIDLDFGEPPHSIVIPAALHFTEKESLKVLHGIREPYLDAFGKKGEPLLGARAKVTIDKTKRALKWVKENFDEDLIAKFWNIIENVECYLEDAKRFLNEGKLDLALIEACYAEGLLDSLRLQGYEIKW